MTYRRNQLHGAGEFLPGLTLAAIVLLTGTVWADEMGRCYSAKVPGEIVLPDGSVHAAGRLRICVARRISPVTVSLKVSVDGRIIGEYCGREGDPEGRPTGNEAIFVFTRSGPNELVLEGCVRPSRGRLLSYDVRWPRRNEMTLAAIYSSGVAGDQRASKLAEGRLLLEAGPG